MDWLRDMALFVQVAEMKSFSRAAEALGMATSSLSQRISGLEQGIGLQLLSRSTRKVALTPAGASYLERCRHILAQARLAHEDLQAEASRPSGVLRVSMPVFFGTQLLAPLLDRFVQHYPGIRFEFDLTPRRAELVGEAVDVAIRSGELADSGLVARRLATLPRHLYASPGYLAAAGTLRRVLPGWDAPPLPISAVTPTRLLPAKTRAFLDFMAAQLGEAAG